MLHMTEREKELEREIRNEQKENQQKWYHYLLSILLVLMGLVFVIYKEMDIPFLCRFFACVFAAAGVISIITYAVKDVTAGYYRLDLAYGMMAIFAAVIFFTKQDDIGEYFPLIAGAILVANGVVKLQHSIDMKRIDRKMKKVTEAWLVVMIFSLICMGSGLFSVFLTPKDMRTLFIFVGIALMVAGASDIFTNIAFNRKVKLFRSGDYKPDEKPETKSEETVAAPEPEHVPSPEPENASVSDAEPEPVSVFETGEVSSQNSEDASDQSS